MGIKDFFNRFTLAGARKRRQEPVRETENYARLMNIGSIYNQRAMLKPTTTNIRFFSRTPYTRQAIRRIRDPLVSLKWKIEPKKGVVISRVLQKQIAIATACLESPNYDDSWRSLIGVMIEDWLCFGAGVSEKQVGTDPIRPLWMWPVDAQSIQIYAGWSGKSTEARYLQTLGYSNVGYLQGRKLRNDELIYIPANSSTETPFGYGPLEIAYNSISRQLATAEYAGNLASNAQPQSLLHFKGADPDKVNAFRTYWQNEIEGQGVTPMFGTNADIESISLHPGNDNALYLEYQEFVIREIATAFGLSPMNLGVEHDVNRSTAETSKDRDWDNTIVPLAELISSYITREALHQSLHFYQLEFKFEALYREDEESIANIFQTYYKNNAITPNEHREEIGLPPMDSPWGDKTFADFQIAMSAARGTKLIEDPALVDSPGQVNKQLSPQTIQDDQNESDAENE